MMIWTYTLSDNNMNTIERIACFLQNKGAMDIRLFESTGLDFSYNDDKFELSIDPLTYRGYLSTCVFDDVQMDVEELSESDVMSVVTELSKQSDNLIFFYEACEEKAYCRYAFNYCDYDELIFHIINAYHGLMIQKDTFLRVAAGCRVDAHLDFSFVYSEEEDATYEQIRDFLSIKILYVHGFRSSGKSGTADRLREFLPHCKILSPDLPIDAKEAVAFLKRIVAEEQIDVVVGTSMGGMLTQKLRGVPKILVNPSFFVSETFRNNMGKVSFFSEREDGATEFEITQEVVDSYVAVESGQFRAISQREKNITVGAFGNKDDVVNCKDIFRKHYDNVLYFAGGHRLDADSLKLRIIPAIAKVYRFQHI